MKYIYNETQAKHITDKVIIFILALVVGMLFGWAIISNTQLNNCEHLTDQQGNRWIECNQ